MPITFLQAADIHLDSPLRGLSRYENAPADRIRGAGRTAFARLIDLAIERDVDFLVIAGDLYDGDCRDFNTCLYLTKQLRRLRDASIPAYLISGNHDAANKMTKTLQLPDKIHLFRSDRPETRRLDDLGVVIHGQSFAKSAVTENLAVRYPDPIPGLFNLGMLHTALAGAEGHERYAPCTVEDLRLKDYNYWALGHIHTRGVACDDPPAIFPGNPQGRHIRECGEKGCVLVTIDPSGKTMQEFHRLDVVRWERCAVDASDASSESDLLDRISGRFDQLLASEMDPDRLLAVRVSLTGNSSLHDRLVAHRERTVAEIRSLASDRGGDRLWVEKVEIQTRSTQPFEVYDGPFEELREVIETFRTERTRLATLGQSLFDLKRKIRDDEAMVADVPRLDDPNWLAGLLDDVQPLLLELLAPERDISP